MIKVPECCMVCGSKYTGGSQVPQKPFKDKGERVFYKCGASMSIKEMKEYSDTAYYLILFKNCGQDKGGKP